MSVLAHALRLSARVPVFPCRSDKRPACPHGFKDAVRSENGIADLWRQHPGPLIGVPTGATSGFDVIDVDPRHGGDTWLAETGRSLPVTRVHHTRSGGRHLLFRHADGVRNSASKIAPGVDVRGDGGYVVWWPASGCPVENAKTLSDWPACLLQILSKPHPRPTPPRTAGKLHQRKSANGGALATMTASLARLEMASPGQKHERLRAAACTLGGLIDELGFTEAEAEDVLWAAVLRAGGVEVVERNARSTIAWGLHKGRLSPLRLEDR